MFYIAIEDIAKVVSALRWVIASLGNGTKRVDKEIDLGEDFKPLVASGYWVNDVMRIDIKVKK